MRSLSTTTKRKPCLLPLEKSLLTATREKSLLTATRESPGTATKNQGSHKQTNKLSAIDSHNQVPREAKALSDQVFAVIEDLSEMKEDDAADWLLLRVLAKTRKEK